MEAQKRASPPTADHRLSQAGHNTRSRG